MTAILRFTTLLDDAAWSLAALSHDLRQWARWRRIGKAHDDLVAAAGRSWPAAGGDA